MRRRRTYAERQRSFRASAGPTARLICADEPGRIWNKRRQAVGTRRGSTELIQHAAERRRLPILDLDPVPEPAAAVETLAMFRDHAFQPHQAGVARQGRVERRAKIAASNWPCASPAAACGDPRSRSPGCRTHRTALPYRAGASVGR